jgi:hypothetical protein
MRAEYINPSVARRRRLNPGVSRTEDRWFKQLTLASLEATFAGECELVGVTVAGWPWSLHFLRLRLLGCGDLVLGSGQS